MSDILEVEDVGTSSVFVVVPVSVTASAVGVLTATFVEVSATGSTVVVAVAVGVVVTEAASVELGLADTVVDPETDEFNGEYVDDVVVGVGE